MNNQPPIIAISSLMKEGQFAEVTQLAPGYRVVRAEDLTPADYPAIEVLYGFDAAIVAHLLAGEHENFRWLQLETAGTNQVPDALWEDDTVMITTMSGIHATPITETVFGYLLMFYRGLDGFYQEQATGNWDRYRDLKSLDDKTLLIYGTGHIAQKMARVAHAFDAQVFGVNTTGHAVAGFDQTYTQASVQSVLKTVDVVINTMPGTKATENSFNQAFFAAVKPGVVFINIGRGQAVDEAALLAAVQQGIVSHAGLDVFATEPLPQDHPFWQEPNIFVTPHISGTVEHFANETYRIFLPNLKAYLATGAPSENRVNKDKRY